MSKREAKADNTVVVRIYKPTHKRLKALKGSKTFIEFLDDAIDTIEMLATKEPVYVVGNKIFEKLPEARGEAIQIAAQGHATNWELPYIAVILGQDTGEA